MQKIESVKVGETVYNVVPASAIKQKELLLIIGAMISINSATSQSEIEENLLLGSLLRLPETKFDAIADIVLHKVVESGGGELVTIDNFQGNITEFFQLVVKAIRVNLDDFFIWLDDVNKEGRMSSRPETKA